MINAVRGLTALSIYEIGCSLRPIVPKIRLNIPAVMRTYPSTVNTTLFIPI